MLADPDRYGSRYVQRLSGTVIPTGLAQWARTEDPALREARTIMDNIRSRYSPGSRRELYPRLDRFGEPIVREDPFLCLVGAVTKYTLRWYHICN